MTSSCDKWCKILIYLHVPWNQFTTIRVIFDFWQNYYFVPSLLSCNNIPELDRNRCDVAIFGLSSIGLIPGWIFHIKQTNRPMMTSSNGNIFALLAFVWGIHRSPVNSPHKGQWHGALMFSLICVWINGWVNNGEACDLRRHRGHYDVNVMRLFDTTISLLTRNSLFRSRNTY